MILSRRIHSGCVVRNAGRLYGRPRQPEMPVLGHRGTRRDGEFCHRLHSTKQQHETDGNKAPSSNHGDEHRHRVPADHEILSTIPFMGRGVEIGQYGTVTRTYTSEEVESFARLIRDFNPLHSSLASTDDFENGSDLREALAAQERSLEAAGLVRPGSTGTSRVPLVHGALVSTVFSSVFAHLAPGCVYLHQTVGYVSPVFAGDATVGCVRVESIRDWNRGKRPRARGGVVARCSTLVYALGAPEPGCANARAGPVPATLAVRGHADVWLPMGHRSEPSP